MQHVWVNHDQDLLDVTLHEDGQNGHATEASSTDKTQQVATKAHGSQAPPSPSQDETDETIHTTENHPWLTTDRGWVTAGDLHVGEQVVELGGRTATITALAVHPGAATYYNLTVSKLHTYAVGTSQAVVHNCAKPLAARMSDLGRDTAQEILEEQGYTGFVREVQFQTPGGKPRVDLAAVDGKTLIVAESKNGLGARLTKDQIGGYPYFTNQDVANIVPVGPNAAALKLQPGVSLQAQGIENVQFFYFRFLLYPPSILDI